MVEKAVIVGDARVIVAVSVEVDVASILFGSGSCDDE